VTARLADVHEQVHGERTVDPRAKVRLALGFHERSREHGPA